MIDGVSDYGYDTVDEFAESTVFDDPDREFVVLVMDMYDRSYAMSLMRTSQMRSVLMT